LLVLSILVQIIALNAHAKGDPNGAATLKENPELPVDFVWVLVSAFLVFFMQAGFAMVEAGFTRPKNTINVMFKNLADFTVASIAFYLVGYAFMMGSDWKGVIGTSGFALLGDYYDVQEILVWFFMLVFAGTAATIVSGAIAERPKFIGYLLGSIMVTAFIYPVYGHWIWGGGWLSQHPFLERLAGGYGALDFAGSGAVHALGGYVALAALLVLGPRIGRYDEKGNPRPIPGHNLALAALGTFILWFAWFGFNAGSTLSAHELRISIIAANTNLAAAAGALTAMTVTWLKLGKPELGLTLNGALGGLVAITAPCAWVAPWAAIVIGIVAGFIVTYGYWWLERRGIDDAVGAVPVHGFCGTWGLIALGIFADGTYGVYTTEPPLVTGLLYGNPGFLAVQLISAVVNFAWAFGTGYIVYRAIDRLVGGLRASSSEETIGLDVAEHMALAYPYFVQTEMMPSPTVVKKNDAGNTDVKTNSSYE